MTSPNYYRIPGDDTQGDEETIPPDNNITESDYEGGLFDYNDGFDPPSESSWREDKNNYRNKIAPYTSNIDVKDYIPSENDDSTDDLSNAETSASAESSDIE